MAGRSRLPMPTRSTRRVASVVRTVVEPGPSCPAISRLPRASGLRPPRTYVSASPAPCVPAAPCSPRYRTPPPCVRPPPCRAGIPRASGLRAPRAVCRLPQRARSPPPPCAAAPCAPPPCAPAPCAPPPCAPAPCPAASPPSFLEDMTSDHMTRDCDCMRALRTAEEAEKREELRAAWEAAMAAYPDSPGQQQERERKEREAQEEQRRQIECRCAQERARLQLCQMEAEREQMKIDHDDKRQTYKLTLEAIEEMLMEERDIMLRAQVERLLRRAQNQVTSQAQWRAALGIADCWRRDMLENYRHYARSEALLFANKELLEKKRKAYRNRTRRRCSLSPVAEPQVDVFDDSPPRACAAPMLPDRVFRVSAPCHPPTLMDLSPPLDSMLQAPLVASFPVSPATFVRTADDWFRDARRELGFDTDDDSEELEGAVGGAYI